MANEAVKVELTNGTGNQRRFTCAAGTAITKGTLLTLTDPRTAIYVKSLSPVMAGIAAMDKDSADTSTSITCYTDGIFELVASGTIAIGSPVIAYGNLVQASTSLAASGAAILGYALEAATDAETINVRVRL